MLLEVMYFSEEATMEVVVGPLDGELSVDMGTSILVDQKNITAKVGPGKSYCHSRFLRCFQFFVPEHGLSEVFDQRLGGELYRFCL